MATTTVSSSMPGWYQSYMQNAMQRGQNLANTPFQAYGGQQVAGTNPYLQQGWQMAAQRASQGSPLMQQANQVVGDTMSGQYMNGNPYLDRMAAQTRQNVASDINRQFGVNAWGGSAQQELMAKGMSQAENALRYNDYANERQNQLRAANYAPQLAQSGYMDANMLNQIGTQRQGLDYQEFLRGQQWPLDMQNAYLRSISLQPGGTQTTNTPNPSRASSMLGGAMGGAALGRMAAPWLEDTLGLSSGWSTAAGAGLGGLLGGFF